jgi:serine/threonine protein phosphatase 1
MTPIYAVGDIHGRLDELRRVLGLIKREASGMSIDRPRIVYLGDYIDRGPDSKGVLDLLVSPWHEDEVDTVYLNGNHDAALLAIIALGEDPMDWLYHYGGADCVESYGVTIGGNPPPIFMRRFHDDFPVEHLKFLSELRTWYRNGNWLFTHAGLDPFAGWDDEKAQRIGMIWGHHKFLESDTDFGVRVVHGHWRTDNAVIRPNRIGIDTGCGFPNGRLTAVVLEDDKVRVLAQNVKTA